MLSIIYSKGGQYPILDPFHVLSDMFVDCILFEIRAALDGMLRCACLLAAVPVYNQTGQAAAEGLRSPACCAVHQMDQIQLLK